jgi:hypothetical protein
MDYLSFILANDAIGLFVSGEGVGWRITLACVRIICRRRPLIRP